MTRFTTPNKGYINQDDNKYSQAFQGHEDQINKLTDMITTLQAQVAKTVPAK